ncbi:hypothetical protein HU200_022468 [Digitaria exilis]|uniref:Uncharacterized protein n=1 Tax=Digitaria exilis TaxID=1010633 RepID=A0A835C4R1_9POAL|nr:hypothetical protein HU200_022468 [Digitaria exilis]
MATQRRGASGRPSGTDGSDFSYRMGRRLPGTRGSPRADPARAPHPRADTAPGCRGCASAAVFVQGEGAEQVAVLSVAAGLLAVVVGELGDIPVLTSIAAISYVLVFSTPKKELD